MSNASYHATVGFRIARGIAVLVRLDRKKKASRPRSARPTSKIGGHQECEPHLISPHAMHHLRSIAPLPSGTASMPFVCAPSFFFVSSGAEQPCSTGSCAYNVLNRGLGCAFTRSTSPMTSPCSSPIQASPRGLSSRSTPKRSLCPGPLLPSFPCLCLRIYSMSRCCSS